MLASRQRSSQSRRVSHRHKVTRAEACLFPIAGMIAPTLRGRIHERLLQRFARDVVFKDVDSIPLGIDFRQHLENALSQCRVLIAVIGDQWIERGSATGKRRIDDPRDQLRIELEVALGRNIPVIPVLVRKASMPLEEDLPPSLKSLAYRNGIQIRPDPDFNGDMDRLIKGIEPHLSR